MEGKQRMSDEQTASTLTLVAAILQLIMSLGVASMTFMMFLPLFGLDPFFWSYLLWTIMVLPIALGFIGLIFAILWFSWRKEPSRHKTGLIVSGVLGLLFAGFIPGLLVLIAGAIAPAPSAYVAPMPTKLAQPVRGIRYCPSCGQAIDDTYAQYCWRCGASL
jgi:hypothetical protein